MTLIVFSVMVLIGGMALAQISPFPPLGPSFDNIQNQTPLGPGGAGPPLGPSNGGSGGSTPTSGPTVLSVTPNTGTTAGGTTVTIVGTQFIGLSGAGAVVFGATNAASYTVLSSTTISAVTPAHTAATVDVRVTNSIGTSPTNAPFDNFTFSTCTNSLDFTQACNSVYINVL